MGGGKSKRLNVVLRNDASTTLFPILSDLGIPAALTHEAALALHRSTQNAFKNASKEIKVVVKLTGELSIEGLCTAVVSHARGGCHFKRGTTENSHLDFISPDPQVGERICRVFFIQSGGTFPIILEDFDEIVHISEIPVLPIHAVLLEKLITRSRLPAPEPWRSRDAKFAQQCLVASGGSSLQHLSPLWQTPEILDQVLQHAQKVPETRKRWIAFGFDPSILTPLPPEPVLPEVAKNDEGGHAARSNAYKSKRPVPVANTRLNVTIQGPGNGHTPVTDVAARRVVSLLEDLGFLCALSGSSAAHVYSRGETRILERLDIIVLPPPSFSPTQAWLSQQLFQRDPNNFTYDPANETLFYNFDPDLVLPQPFQNDRTCKVELLLPGTPGVPRVPPSCIVWIADLPVVPFLTLLLYMLEKWGDQRNKRDNTRDLKRLLTLVPSLPVSVFRPWKERKLMSATYQAKSEVRVKKFCQTTLTKPIWKMLGFEVEP
ncbi:hypothetical protein MD484_g5236, partial [Candolleomyces efflorescens]